MAAFREGTVIEILESSQKLMRAEVEVDGARIEAAGFPGMLGPLETGNRVVVNTTGIDLHLGTGGVGFILWNLDGPRSLEPGTGHIMKMRYTPWQTEVAAVEASESAHHTALEGVRSINGMPVVVCGLHSQIAGAAAGIRQRAPQALIAYVMTDGGALPLAWSRLVRSLQEAGLIDVTCTIGHAFGGDLEAVNVFSGLAATRVVGGAQVAIVATGPGVTGTGTALGFSAIEQGQGLDAAAGLGGRPIACLRVSFSDERARHRGISHHTITALTLASHAPTTVVVPELPSEQSAALWTQLQRHDIGDRHEIVVADGGPGVGLLNEKGIEVASMGRSLRDAPEGVLAAAAAGAVAAEDIV